MTVHHAMDEVTLTVEPLSATEVMELLKKHKRYSFVNGQKMEEFDDLALRKERFHRLVVGWKGVEDEEGNPLKCDEASKGMILEYESDFVNKVFEAVDALTDQINAEKKEAQKK